MANTYVDYTASASQTDFAFSFPYLEDTHVVVEIDGFDKIITTDFTIPSNGLVRLNSGATAGQLVRVKRVSDFATDLVNFVNGSVLNEADLDKAYQHNRYLNEEAAEGNNASLQLVGGGTDFNANNNKIVNLATPTADNDAVNKSYIDTRIALSGTSLNGFDKSTHTGDNTETQFTLSFTAQVATPEAYLVTIDGVVQTPTTAYSVDTSNNKITFTSAPPTSANIVVVPIGTTSSANDATVVATGSTTSRSLASRFADVVNVLDYIPSTYHASILDGTIDTDLFSYINSAWTDALVDGKSMYFPSGTYLSKSNNFPIGRVNGAVPTSLLDCKNITVFGDGRSTILKTKTATGADVLQINGAKNFHVRDLSITSELTGSSGAGSNCVSITNGGDNITFENVFAYNAAYVDKTTYLDGGKGFTIQTGTPSVPLGKILISNCIVDGCTYGFDLTPVYSYVINQNPSIIFDNCIAENCWYGYLVNAGASTVALPAGWSIGLKFSGMANNCQNGVVLGRGHGVDVDVKVFTNKTKANLKLDPEGTAWSTTLNTNATGAEFLYAHNSKINITGYLNDVDRKIKIGGSSQGPSGLSGATDACELYFDIGGTAVTDIELVNSGGNRVRKSVVYISSTTTSSVDDLFYLPAYDNTIIYGSNRKLISPKIGTDLNFTELNGVTSYVNIQKSGLGAFVQQTAASAHTNKNFGVKDHLGNDEFVVYNNGEIAFNVSATATGIGSISHVVTLRNPATNAITGYIPVYSSFAG